MFATSDTRLSDMWHTNSPHVLGPNKLSLHCLLALHDSLVHLTSCCTRNILWWRAAGLIQELLHLTLDKGKYIRCSNWETCPLSAGQKAYAATDAYAAAKAYQVCCPFLSASSVIACECMLDHLIIAVATTTMMMT